MNSYISLSTPTNRSNEPRGYVTTGLPPVTPNGYISPVTRRGSGSYVTTEWVVAA